MTYDPDRELDAILSREDGATDTLRDLLRDWAARHAASLTVDALAPATDGPLVLIVRGLARPEHVTTFASFARAAFGNRVTVVAADDDVSIEAVDDLTRQAVLRSAADHLRAARAFSGYGVARRVSGWSAAADELERIGEARCPFAECPHADRCGAGCRWTAPDAVDDAAPDLAAIAGRVDGMAPAELDDEWARGAAWMARTVASRLRTGELLEDQPGYIGPDQYRPALEPDAHGLR